MPGPVNYKGIPTNPWLDLEDRIERKLFPVFISLLHRKVHAGAYFTASIYFPDVGSDADVYALIKTGSKVPHLTITVSAGADAFVTLFEDSVIGDNGTSVPVRDHNRITKNTATTTVFKNPTLSTEADEGTALLPDQFIPGGRQANFAIGSTSAKREEWMLAPNTDYLIKVTNAGAASEHVNILTSFYELET